MKKISLKTHLIEWSITLFCFFKHRFPACMRFLVFSSAMEHSIPNGIPPQFAKDIKPSPSTTPPLNGVDSLHSSRNSSPGSRIQQIPASQLPPTRNTQYSTNLPKIDGADIRQTMQGVNNLNISPQVIIDIEFFHTVLTPQHYYQ